MHSTPLQRVSYALYLFGIFLLGISLPWSKFLMSNAQIILLAAWLLDKDLLNKIKAFTKNKTALVLSSLFILHIIGLAYTSDMASGFEDVRKKVPLMLLPLVFSTSPSFTRKVLEKILLVFVLSVIAASFVCFYILLGYTDKIILQPRDASIFISHIRLSLLVCFSVFILGHFFIKNKSVVIRSVILAAIAWLISFMLMMESETGLVCLIIISTLLMIYGIFHVKQVMFKWMLSVVFIFAAILFFIFLRHALNEPAHPHNVSILSVTKNGNPYTSDTLNSETENGYKVWLNLSEWEMAEEWNKQSTIKYAEKDRKGNAIKFTLIRFLTSKGVPKDAASVKALTQEEIDAIEKGIPNVEYMKLFNPQARIEKIKWELEKYIRGGNPSGHSVVQRFEFWKASMGIIKKNLLFGVGTGDMDLAFAEQYDKMNSPLTKEWRLRSHNQYLAITAAFGITGLIIFLLSLAYPVIKEGKTFDYFYITFFLISLLSFLAEDTLETQAGVTFFAFFNSLLLFCGKKEAHTGS